MKNLRYIILALLFVFAATKVQAAYSYYIPVFKPPPSFWSGMGIRNLSNTSTASVTIFIYSKTGSLLSSQGKSIPKNGQDNFLVGTGLSQDGWIKIESSQPLAGFKFLGQYDSGTPTHYYLADVPFTDTPSPNMVLPHVAQNSTWNTLVYVANANSASNTVQLTYTDKAGVSSSPHTIVLSGNGCAAVTVETIADSSDVSGGYVTVSGSKSIAAFAIYENTKTGNISYAGINAVDISELGIMGTFRGTYSGGASGSFVITFFADGTLSGATFFGNGTGSYSFQNNQVHGSGTNPATGEILGFAVTLSDGMISGTFFSSWGYDGTLTGSKD